VGDAHKAILLYHELFDDGTDESEETEENLSDAWRKASQVLCQALVDCHCEAEALPVFEEILKRTGYDKEKTEYLRGLIDRKTAASELQGGTVQEQSDRLHDGGVFTVQYPWIEKKHYRRSPELIAIINQELKRTAEGKEASCYLGNSTLLPGNSDTDFVGMFAARELQPGECILIDRTATGICSSEQPCCSNCYIQVPWSPTKIHCCDHCDALFCSTACRDLATTTYHRVLCGQDFTWLTKPALYLKQNASPLRPLLMLRFLATCVQAGPDKHPLDHPLIARLQARTDMNHIDVFTFNESVITPIKILRQLGINVFENHNFDTTVLHTIWTRLANNKAGSPDRRLGYVDLITPHLPLFNHSCEPNVAWGREEGATTVRFWAKRRIEKGEELFCSYLGGQEMFMGKEERWERLLPWFERPCLCERCKREGKQQGSMD
jgi:hypothetical protein